MKIRFWLPIALAFVLLVTAVAPVAAAVPLYQNNCWSTVDGNTKFEGCDTLRRVDAGSTGKVVNIIIHSDGWFQESLVTSDKVVYRAVYKGETHLQVKPDGTYHLYHNTGSGSTTEDGVTHTWKYESVIVNGQWHQKIWSDGKKVH